MMASITAADEYNWRLYGCYLPFMASRWSSILFILLISALRSWRSSWSPCVYITVITTIHSTATA